MASWNRRSWAMPSAASIGFSGRALNIAQSTASTVMPMGMSHQRRTDTTQG